MKLTTLLLTVNLIQIAALGYSQSSHFNITFNDISLKEALSAIENQSTYKFVYRESDVENKTVTLTANDMAIDEVLDGILANTENHYRILENNLVIIASNEVLQQTRITGIVTDGSTGETLIGVNVSIEGTQGGTITDVTGRYSIETKAEGGVLVFSYIGYLTEKVIVTSQSVIDVQLIPDIQELEEVVVVGYGTQKKSDVTGAMIRVDAEQLKAHPVANTFEAMQGKAAGVDITSNERPGEIGKINIRGIRSLTASSTPLYVVDGIPLMSANISGSSTSQLGIETLNPNDIESVDILKDASATAIYGSRGANGVILVTTKKGKEGKMSFNYSGSVSFETLQDRTKMMTASEYLTWRRWAYYYLNPAVYPRGDEPTQTNDYTIFTGAKDQYAWANIMKGWEGGTWDGSKVVTTDWTDMVIRTGITNEHNLSASGGTDKMKTYVSFGYLDTKGTQKGQEYTRYTTKVGIDLIPVKWFEMGASVNTTYSIQQYGQSTVGGQVSGPGSIYAAANNNLPYAVAYDTDGNRITYPGGDDMIKTVVDEWKYTDNERKMVRALGSLYAQFNILPGLRYRMNFGPDFRLYKNGVYIDAMSVNRVGSPNYASLRNENDFSWTLDNLLYYDKTINKHAFGVTLLQTTSAVNNNYSYMQAQGIPLASQKWNALNMTNVTALNSWDSGLTEEQLMSYMGRFNYSFADKYLLTVSGRWDGASQLAEGHKWEFFPSAALAWRLDQEEMVKQIGWISQLKLRFGIGTTGNSAIQPYQTKGGVVSLFYPYGGTATSGYVPSESLISGGNLAMANPLLEWEKTTQYNVGIDFALVKGRVSGVIDLYTSRTSDLLMQMSIPALTGYSLTYSNIGETKNKGIDLTLNTVNVRISDFAWETNLNAAWQKEEIVSLSNGKEDDISNLWFIGEPVGVVYGYESNGLWHEEDAEEMALFNANGHSFQVGMSRPVDQNTDHKINPNDDRVIIGHTRPRWTVGMTNTFTYKGIELSIFLYGRLGYTYNTGGEWQGGRYVQRSISYYNENNKNADYQKPIYNVGVGDPYYNIMGYKSGSFIKVRNISLGYTFPGSIANKLGIQSLKLYVQAKNPGMLFSKIDWLDMDLSRSGNGTTNDPTVGVSTWNRGFVFGLNVGF